MLEPVVRVRCPSPAEEERARAVLEAAGYRPERSLAWLVVREADPDAVNEALVRGGAGARTAVREQLGRLLGWLLDRRGDLAGRETALRQQVARLLAEAGLGARWTPRPEPELAAAAREIQEHLLASGAGFVPWERFASLFCLPAGPPAAAPGAERAGRGAS